MIEIHPYYYYINIGNELKGGYIPVGTKILIIGTFPPYETYINKGQDYFYYSSEKNQLWNRFDNIFIRAKNYSSLKKTKAKNFSESYEENKKRKEIFIKKCSIGFIDIFSMIERRIYNSSKDKDIIPRETILDNNYLDAILKTEKVVRICCVYSLAYNILKNWILKNKKYSVKAIYDKDTANKEKLLVSGDNRQFEIVLLFPATRSGNKGVLKDIQYKKFILEDNYDIKND